MATGDNEVYLPVMSLLDTDLYKFTMQQAVIQHFPDVQATYRFKHRDSDVYFSHECYDLFIKVLPLFARLAATPEEIEWMKVTCPYFSESYLNYLANFRFKPEQITVHFHPQDSNPQLGRLDIIASGPWVETILWEVPLMACLSELYFRTIDTDWSYDGQADLAYEKGKALLKAGAKFSEFGTRRRRSYYVHDLVIANLVRASKDFPETGQLVGTSNVHFACKYNIRPIGTIAHEWFMGVAAVTSYRDANGRALDLWEKIYPSGPLIALTDTFSTEAFYKDFVKDKARAKRWNLRQDSGDPFIYAPKAKEVFEEMGIDHRTKSIIYSDSLDVDRVLRLQAHCEGIGFNCSFGIGTFLTNDFRSISSEGKRSKALNMVIKLDSANGQHCVKISDDLSKNNGHPEEVVRIKQMYGLLP